MQRRVRISWIYADAAIRHKISHRSGGGCTFEEVLEAFQNTSGAQLQGRPQTDPPEVAGFGRTAQGRELFAAFVAIDEEDGSWALKTAYRV